MKQPALEKPRDWKQNFGGWFWAYLVMMLLWSAISASRGTRAFHGGYAFYGIWQWVVAGGGILCLTAWHLLQNREPVKGDRLIRFPELVLGIFDAVCFGGGAGATAYHNMRTNDPNASSFDWILAGAMIWIGITFIRRAIARRRWLNRPVTEGEDDGQEK